MFTDKLRAMWHDEDAVSPVIGVILMVAVTVVLAAVIGAFVFGMGSSLNQPAPSTQVEFTYNSDQTTLTVNHAGGTTINEENTGKLHVRSNTDTGTGIGYSWGGLEDGASADNTVTIDSGETVTAGEQIVSLSGFNAGDSVDLVWESPDGSSSQVLGSYTAD